MKTCNKCGIEKQLSELGFCWDYLLMGITSGQRILINDKFIKKNNEFRSRSTTLLTRKYKYSTSNTNKKSNLRKNSQPNTQSNSRTSAQLNTELQPPTIEEIDILKSLLNKYFKILLINIYNKFY